jgi:hypothetical protein
LPRARHRIERAAALRRSRSGGVLACVDQAEPRKLPDFDETTGKVLRHPASENVKNYPVFALDDSIGIEL